MTSRQTQFLPELDDDVAALLDLVDETLGMYANELVEAITTSNLDKSQMAANNIQLIQAYLHKAMYIQMLQQTALLEEMHQELRRRS